MWKHARNVSTGNRTGMLAMALVAVLASGCGAPRSYRAPKTYTKPPVREFSETNPQFERGAPFAPVDALGHYVFSLPSKLVLWNWGVCNHDISPESEQLWREYIADNKLTKVKVRVNQYSPGGEIRRLVENNDVSPFYRYTFGVVSVLVYTVLPDRLFGGLIGGDHYNPYTNTVSIFSDVKAIGLHEGGHAKDFAQQEMKGTYAFARLLTPLTLLQEYAASDDAVQYAMHRKDAELEKSSYKILYPAFFTYLGAATGLPGASAVLAIPGHIVGRIKAGQVSNDNYATALTRRERR